jgi:hypothetical protein
VTIDLSRIMLKNGDLEQMTKLTSVQKLKLGYTQVTDTGLQPLAGAEHINSLYLNRAGITDGGVRHLASMTGTKVTDADIEQLKAAVSSCKITG